MIRSTILEGKNRTLWVDALKFLGILAIYTGHFGSSAGRLHLFVFQYHVPLFFFVSGFFATSNQRSTLNFIKAKTIQLMVPYAVFSVVALSYFSLVNNWNSNQILETAKPFLFGIRNQLVANSLWFIPCLFIVSIIHYLVMKISKRHIVSILVSIIFFIGCQSLLPNNPIQKPTWVLNLDSALYYYLYFAIGAAFFPILATQTESALSRRLSGTASFFAIIFASVLFFEGPEYFLGKIFSYLPWLGNFGTQVNLYLYIPISALILIYANIAIAKTISSIQIFQNLGQETLALCGTENVFKDFLSQAATLFGISINLSNPLITLVYACLCLFGSYYSFVPHVNRLIDKLKRSVRLAT
jgi:fucose 4-O-acetylase-like acetyltransferase